ncbi:MAG TPA: muconolactone Delta-isomerase family protein [Candidatus Acidoferrum sp.]|nr:muconolactone Delta-isomerase family protein [Candidatus Acidoferrum sp.]
MQYLVQMKLVPQGRPTTPEEGTAFIEQYIFPTLELCKKLQDEKKILAGGPTSGAVGLVLIVNAESARELDDLITSLPVWPRMETAVVPLTTFEGRAESLRPRLERQKGTIAESWLACDAPPDEGKFVGDSDLVPRGLSWRLWVPAFDTA